MNTTFVFTWRTLLLCSIVPLAGCAGDAQIQNEPVLEVREVGSCYGCPQFSIKLFQTGQVVYTGEAYVRTIGEAKSSIPPETVNDLLNDLRSTGFAKMAANYRDPGNPDDETFQITERQGGRAKSVIFNATSLPHGKPLVLIVRKVFRTVQVQQWICPGVPPRPDLCVSGSFFNLDQ